MHFRQFIFFGIFGAAGAILDISLLYSYVEIIKINTQLSFFLSSLTTMLFIFFANKYITFKRHNNHIAKQATRFFMVYIAATALNGILSTILLSMGLQYLISKLLAIICIAVMNYCLSHYFIFKQ